MKPKPVINKLYLLLFTCIALTAVIIESCKKDNHTDQQTNITDPAVLGAKNWYESTYSMNPGKQNTQAIDTSIDWSQLVKPDWNHPASYNRFDNDVIEMPLDASSKMAIGLKNTKSGQATYNPDYSRSSFLLLKQEGIYNAYIMTIIADAAYLKGDITKLDGNKYNKRDNDFSGAVIYSTPKGHFVSGWLYKNGVLINKISTVGTSSTGSVSTKGEKTIQSVKPNGWVPMQTTTDWYQVSSTGGSVTSIEYLGATTSISYEYVDDGGGLAIPPVGSSGGSGGTAAGGPSSPYPWIPPPCPDQYPVGMVTQAVGHNPTVNIAKPPDQPQPIDGSTGFPPPDYGNGGPPCSITITAPALDVSALSKYPKFKALASDLPNFLSKYPNITKALAYYTGFTEDEILKLMQPGRGPKIVTVPNLKDEYGVELYGKYDAVTKTILINENFAKGFEVAQSETTIQATALLLAITTLHEFVHYGRDQNKLSNLYQGYEAGWTFEMNIDPNATGINRNNAVKWINYYPYNFN